MCSCGCMLKSARILICQQRQSTFIFIYFLFKTHSSCLGLVPAATSGTLLNFLILPVCFSCSLPTFLRNCTTSCLLIFTFFFFLFIDSPCATFHSSLVQLPAVSSRPWSAASSKYLACPSHDFVYTVTASGPGGGLFTPRQEN